MTGKDLWTIFDEECRKDGTIALLFGVEFSIANGRSIERSGPPEDLTLWNTIAARLERGTIDTIVDVLKKKREGLRHA
jgi:hypothetical protein